MFTQFRFFFLLRWMVLGVFLLLIGATSPIQAKAGERLAAADDPTAQLVNPDGTLNLQTGFQGSLDLVNWQVSLDPQRGPLLAPQASEWSGLNHGVSSQVAAIAVNGNNIYVGGSFTEICGNETCDSGNLQAKHIARWNGSAWQTVGFGLNFAVYSLAVGINGELYVGGDFSEICGNPACNEGNIPANRIVRWDGSAWSALDQGLDSSVLALAVAPNGDVYAGGAFQNICGNATCSSNNTPARRVAKYDDLGWTPLSFGLNLSVNSVAFSGSNLIVGGYFSNICGNPACNSGNMPANHVAQWDGLAWSALGNGFNDNVNVIATQGSQIIAGGYFHEACGNISCDNGNVRVNSIAAWNGIAWTPLGFGLNGWVSALVFSEGGDLFVGGGIELCGNLLCDSGNIPVNNVAQWDGGVWSGLDNGLNDSVRALAIGGDGLVAGGIFTHACGTSACDSGNVRVNNIAQIPIHTPIVWNNPAGGSWSTAANWTPQQVPGSGDESVFNLEASYDVTVGTRTSGRSRIENGSVSFRNADLTLIGPLTVGGDATFTLPEGSLNVGELIIGSLPPTDPLNPPTAHVFVSNQGTEITGDTAITVGNASNGDLLISDAKLTSGPVTIGADSPGTAVLTGVHGEWMTAGIVVGAGYTATLDIEHGGLLRSGDAAIGQGDKTAEHLATVRIDNAGSPLPAFGANWLASSLALGGNLPGKLIIENGGLVGVSYLFQAGLAAHDVAVWDASLVINGISTDGGNASSFVTFEDALFGMAPGTDLLVQILGGAEMQVLGNLSLAHEENSDVFVKVSGVDAPTDFRATLKAAPNAPDKCWIGLNGYALLEILSGASFQCNDVLIGNFTGSQGEVYVHGAQAGDFATLDASGYLCVGGFDQCGTTSGVPGSLTLQNGGVVFAAGGLGVGPAGRLRGSGTIVTLFTIIHGQVEPGIGFEIPLIPIDPDENLLSMQPVQDLPAALTFSGSVTISATAVITLDVRGLTNHDQLIVTGDLTLSGGTLALAFSNGYAPQQGDTYEFFLAESVTGDFNQVTITGLAPGFEYTISTTNGVITLTALNDGVPTTEAEPYLIYLPVIVR